MGAVCGAVSGDLLMFELEGRFMARFGPAEFLERAREFGVELTVRRMLTGVVVRSPSDGRHFIVRVVGAVDGNTKLARDSDGNTLIETRGEGGFVILPPSHGSTHPSGNAWASTKGEFADIVTLTADEIERLYALARSYDETPAPKPHTPVSSAQKVTQSRYTGNVGESWFDAVLGHLAATWTMRGLLEHYGWTWCYDDRHGRQLLRRPGKDEGVSGSINTNGRFHPFSSTTPFPSARADKGAPTYDLLDVIAVYEHHGDRDVAAREIADTTGIMRTWQRGRDAQFRAAAGIDDTVPPPPNVDPTTGEIINDDIWERRWYLAHIRDAARSRMVAPHAVFGCVVARVAAFTPPSTCIPPIVGGRAPLSLYVALHGSSGAGKSSPAACAADLLPETPAGCVGPLGLGSGEGMVEAFMDLVEEEDGGGRKRKVKRHVHRGALFMLDEGQMLAEIGARKGSTILPVLRTAWSGDDPGQANASIETRRSLRKGSYHVGLISLWQDKAGAALIDDADGGTPQRFIWLPTTDPTFPDNEPDWPGEIEMGWPPTIAHAGQVVPNPLGIDDEIRAEIKQARRTVIRGHAKEPPLDAHRRLNKLKLAGVLALLDGRHHINIDDWQIAEHFMCVSDAVRDMVIDRNRDALAAQVRADAKRHALREVVAQDAAADRALERAAKSAWRVASRSDQPVSRREITIGIASRDRGVVTPDEAIDEAVKLSWLTPSGDGWTVGKGRPS
jgi:hypothetical protein